MKSNKIFHPSVAGFNKSFKKLASFIGGTCSLLVAYSAIADNPLVSHVYTADPAANVFNDRVYVLTTHDPDGSTSYANLQDYFLWSSDDMVNWQDHGIVFGAKTHTTWAGGAYAPDMFERNGKFYLIFPAVTSGLGILEADKPEGPYKDIKGSAVITSRNTQNANVEWLFDPGVLVDDDNSVYVTFGGGGPGNARIVKLTDDLKGPAGAAVTVDAPNFFEASYIHKRNGVYYFSYSKNYTNGSPTIQYMTSSSPMTGYTFRGTVIPQPFDNFGGNNHHSFIDYKGKSYAFYHNETVYANGPGNGSGSIYQRSMNVDLLTYNGTAMNEVKTTREGVPQIKNFDPFRKVEAEIIDRQSGIETERNGDGSMHVQMDNNDWYRVSQVDFGAGANIIQANVAASSNTSLEVRVDSENGPLIGTIQINSTGGLSSFKSVTATLNGVSGVKNLYFKAKGRLNFNWYEFTGEPKDCGMSGGYPVCCEMSSDADRDGMGTEWGKTCKVTESGTNGYQPLNGADIVAAINVGGDTGDYYQNVYYQPDVNVTGGSTQTVTDFIMDAGNSKIFNSERYGDFTYQIPVAAGTYNVSLHFAELYHETQSARVFNVDVEGNSALSNFDLFSEVGNDAAYNLAPVSATVSDGNLTISVSTVTDNGTLSGILVKSGAAASTSSSSSSSSVSSGASSSSSGTTTAGSTSNGLLILLSLLLGFVGIRKKY